MGVVDTIEWACVLCGCYIQNEQVEQWIHIKFCIKLEHSSMGTIQMIQKAAAMGNRWLAASSRQHACSCITSHTEFFVETSDHPLTQPHYSPDFASCDFWLFSKLKAPLKGKRFECRRDSGKYSGAADGDSIKGFCSVLNSGRNAGRTVWGAKVPTLKGTEASLSYVQSFLYLLQ